MTPAIHRPLTYHQLRPTKNPLDPTLSPLYDALHHTNQIFFETVGWFEGLTRGAQKNSTFEFSSCTQKLWWCYLREAQKCLGLVSYFKNDPALCISIFGSVLKEKRLKTVQKVHFLNICWFLIQKWKTHETNVHSTILGECWHEKVALVFGYRHSKSHFWAPEYGHFWPKLQKVPIFRGPKMGLWVSVSKNWGHFFMPTFPQNGGMDICFMRFPLLDEKSANI